MNNFEIVSSGWHGLNTTHFYHQSKTPQEFISDFQSTMIDVIKQELNTPISANTPYLTFGHLLDKASKILYEEKSYKPEQPGLTLFYNSEDFSILDNNERTNFLQLIGETDENSDLFESITQYNKALDEN